MHLQIGSFSGSAVSPSPSSSAHAKESLKQFLRVNLLAGRAEMERTVATPESAKALEALERIARELCIGIDSGVAELIVELSLFVVREDFVGFGGFLEFVRGCFIVL